LKAMILAAGLGTRLRPITETIPKALVEINGRPLLEWTILRLIHFGFNEIIINTHHFAEKISAFLESKNNFGTHIVLSNEEILLNTGGGLKKAGWFFNDTSPFLMHNVDVLSNLNLTKLYDFHLNSDSLVTLAVRDRHTSRYLMFDQNDNLCGWKSLSTGESILPKNADLMDSLSFMGIHMISPGIIPLLDENQSFSIIDTYLRLIGSDYVIKGYRADKYQWLDLGKKEDLDNVSKVFDHKFFTSFHS